MAPTRRQLLRRRVVALVALVGLAGAGTYVPATLLAPLDEASATVQVVDTLAQPASTPTFPGYGSTAIGAVGFEGILAQSGDTAARPIASISKVVTALVVLEEHPLEGTDAGPTVTLTDADTALYSKYLSVGGTVKPMRAGWAFTERELLEVMLVASANNYAELLAGWAFGSQEAFVTATRAWLDDHGLDSIALVEPTGMSPQNVAGVVDLVALGELALEHPVVAEIVGSSSVDIPSLGLVKNSNDLLGIGGVDGIKTGTLDEAGACLLFASDFAVGGETITVVGVVLGGVDHDSLDLAIQSLLSTVQAGFHEVTLATAGEEFARYSTDWQESAPAVATADLSVVVWSDSPISTAVTAAPLTSGDEGDPAGTVEFTVAGPSRAGPELAVPLELGGDLPLPDGWWRMSHPADLIPG